MYAYCVYVYIYMVSNSNFDVINRTSNSIETLLPKDNLKSLLFKALFKAQTDMTKSSFSKKYFVW